MEDELRDAVVEAAGRAEVRLAVADIYAALGRAIDARRPLCSASGRCCRFEEFGHRLYVTTMELARFVGELPPVQPPAPSSAPVSGRSLPVLPANHAWDGTGCPFQVDRLCGVHASRPFGCRIYFCDATSTDWQHDQYEQFHARLRSLHDQLNVPYHYVEWRFALKALGL